MSEKFWSAIIVSALVAIGSNASANDESDAADSALPALLEPYVDGERPIMGDYRWMRGEFPGASEQDRRVSKAAMTYGAKCYESHRAAVVAQLRSLGIEPVDNSVSSILYECSAFNGMKIAEGTTWAQFQDALETARPLVNGIVYASDYALHSADDDDLSLAGALRTRFVADQTVRNALIASFRGKEIFSGLDDLQRSIASDILSQQVAKIDADNSEFLDGLIATDKWPRISAVGEEAAHDAWLLIQHADANPALQLLALRQMEALLDDQDVSAKDYAYLYDRVMLKIAGEQRYATQFECKDGTRVPQPLESDIESADRYRAAAGLETLAQNLARMEDSYGACPKP